METNLSDVEITNAQPSNRRRPVIFDIVRTDIFDESGNAKHHVVVAQPFETRATDEQLHSWLQDTIGRLQELRDATTAEKIQSDAKRAKRFAFYIRDLDEDVQCRPVILPVADEINLQDLRNILVQGLLTKLQSHKSNIYRVLIEYVEQKGWLWEDLAKAKNKHLWREVCCIVPFFLSEELSEFQRDEFARKSLQTILKGLRDGVYTSKTFKKRRTRVKSSRKKTDHSSPIRARSKKSKPRV